MQDLAVSMSDLLMLAQFLAILGGALMFVFKLGGKLDRLSTAIEHLSDSLTDHEARLRALEHPE